MTLAAQSSSLLLRVARVILPAIRDAYVTLGDTIYVPDTVHFDMIPNRILDHEAVHVSQWRRYGRVGFALRYLCWPLPIGLCYGRWVLEREAYLVEILKHGRAIDSCVAAIDSQLYLWPWPRTWMRRWFADRGAEALSGL